MLELARERAADEEVVYALRLQPVIRPETTSRAIAQDTICGGAHDRRSIKVVRDWEMGPRAAIVSPLKSDPFGTKATFPTKKMVVQLCSMRFALG